MQAAVLVDRAERAVGRNTTHVTVGADGLVFVKRFDGEPSDARRRYRNSLAWEEVQQAHGLTVSPPVVARDEAALTLTFRLVQDARSLQELMGEGGNPAPLVRQLTRAGELLGAVHSLELARAGPEELEEGAYGRIDTGTPLGQFLRLTAEQYAAASGAELECWQLFHHDEELRTALTAWLETMQSGGPPVPVHGDLRPDQFLIAPEGMVIVDWEEFSAGLPTRDLAGVAGAFVFDALQRSFTEATDGATPVEAHHAFVRRGGELLEAAAPFIARFLAAYGKRSGRVVDRTQLGADIGWYLIERVLARAMLAHRLPASDKAIAGIGRQALVRPDSLSGLLGAGDDLR